MSRLVTANCLLATIACLLWQTEAYGDVKLTSDGPAVLGSVVTFKAEVVDSNGEVPPGKFGFTWHDDALRPHKNKTDSTTNTISYFRVEYKAPEYHVGVYHMEVIVCNWILGGLFCPEYASRRIQIRVSSNLNGNLHIEQNNKTMEGKFISTSNETHLSVDLRQGDYDYITSTATSILTYWFIDCKPFNYTTDMKFNYNFTKPSEFHTIQALVIASYDQPVTTTIAPTTTTSTTSSPVNLTIPVPSNSNSSIITTTTTTAITTTTTTPTTTTITTAKPTESSNETAVLGNLTFPFVCGSTIIPITNKTYGYFQKEVNTRAPISKLNIEGATYIDAFQELQLTLTWNGTPPFYQCIELHTGTYNVTGNETCDSSRGTKLDVYQYKFSHFFFDYLEWTVLIILSNDISTEVHPVAVNIVKKVPQPQLSVIVVPVSCSLVAIVVVIFGIAYWVQSRARFTVEVADFDFGQSNTDMEYKTFTERLRDSFNNAGYKQLDENKDNAQ
ncbi:uncharacterized protein LOC131664447 [Phymastichus coffea]|uniref:uncharacterized protein LOC131664447 n=1 Tax=Phymastichus coffea TaxID=108790 RepID=UPI00273CE54D|nr:uncharacterized protein LOC131664447 [Phymastichus coffea]